MAHHLVADATQPVLNRSAGPPRRCLACQSWTVRLALITTVSSSGCIGPSDGGAIVRLTADLVLSQSSPDNTTITSQTVPPSDGFQIHTKVIAVGLHCDLVTAVRMNPSDFRNKSHSWKPGVNDPAAEYWIMHLSSRSLEGPLALSDYRDKVKETPQLDPTNLTMAADILRRRKL